MTSIIEKRLSLHRRLADQQQQNDALKSQISQLQALANIGTATCMIAHEINNLLTPLANFAALALKDLEDRALTEKALQKVVWSCKHASKIMESMLAMANGETEKRKNVRLVNLIEEIFTCLCRDFTKDGITVKIQIPEDLEVWVVPVQIQQVLMNLILNARDAMLPRGGILTIRAGSPSQKKFEIPQLTAAMAPPQEKTDAVQIEVSDTGCGIEPANLKNIFEPFFTMKDKSLLSQKRGAGLGLAFCKQIIDAHGGSISVYSQPAKGSTFRITLPKPQSHDN